MLLVLLIRLFSSQSRWLERLYLRWTQLRKTSVSLGLALEVTRSKPELLLENALLRQQRAAEPGETERANSPDATVAPGPNWTES